MQKFSEKIVEKNLLQPHGIPAGPINANAANPAKPANPANAAKEAPALSLDDTRHVLLLLLLLLVIELL